MQSLSERHRYYRDLEPDDAPARLSLSQLRTDMLGTQKLLVREHDGFAFEGAELQGQRKLAQPVFDKALMARVVEIAGVLTTQLLASWRFRRARAAVDRFVYERIDERLAGGGDYDDILGGRAPVPEDLKALAYTSLVIQESLAVYPPFSAGQRRCLGATFATVEMLTVLAVAGQRMHVAARP
jgi:cytochrome P450